jgi:ligand-binding sensor domain-containing protein
MYAGTSGGVYRSLSGAEIWEKANEGLVPAELVKSSRALGVTMIEVDRFEPDTVYAATLNGLYKSLDKGAMWKRIGEKLTDPIIPVMVLDRTRKGVLYIAGRFGVLRSEDGGESWQSLNQGLATLNVRSLVQSPTNPKLFYLGTNGSGMYRSEDAGTTWAAMPPVKSKS